MYRVVKTVKSICGKTKVLYGIADGDRILIDFTTDESEAENAVNLMNKNNVEPNHVLDVIEDLFYS